jgi:hypothetical protein
VADALDALLNCTLGGAAFSLRDYGFREEVQFRDGAAVGTKITLRGTGEIRGSSASELSANLDSVRTAFRNKGYNFQIFALGVLEMQVLAAESIDGGPFTESFEALPQLQKDGERLVKQVDFVITNITAPPGDDGGGDEQTEPKKITTRTKPDGARVIEYVGKLTRADVETFWSRVQLPALIKPYPPATWVPEIQAERTGSTVIDYRVAFTELVIPIPDNVAADVVDEEFTYSEERDDQQRLIETRSYNLLVKPGSNIISLRDKIRPQSPTVILRERFSYTNFHEKRLQAEFVILRSGSGNDLLEWENSLQFDEESNPVTPVKYVGLRPMMLRSDFPVFTAVQTGRAVGLGKYPKAANKMFDSKFLGDTPKIRRRPINEVERETTWSYSFANDTQFNVQPADLAKLARPDKPDFL